jgi:mRNA interferase YafQ
MALELLTTTAFEKDLRRLRKQGRDLDRLEAIVDLLQAQERLPVRCRPHPFARELGRALGLPCGARLAAPLQDDREGTDSGSDRQPR